MPPALDVQVLRPTIGEEWRWADVLPEEGVTSSVSVFGSAGLLTVEDRDETWSVSSFLVDLDPALAWRRGAWGAMADLPLRAEWKGQANVGDPRLSLLAGAHGWTVRGGVVAPVGLIDWPYSWADWRVDGGVSWAGPVAASVGASHGRAGTVVHGSAGVRWGWGAAEASTFHDVSGGLLRTGEVTFSGVVSAKRFIVHPFASVGVLTTPGTPAVRVGLSARTRKPPATPAPPPVVPEPPSLPLVPVVEEPPPPLSTLPPPPLEPPHVPRVTRARIEQHAACAPRPNEAALVEGLTEQARAYLRDKSADDALVEVVQGACAPQRWVDLIVVEVR